MAPGQQLASVQQPELQKALQTSEALEVAIEALPRLACLAELQETSVEVAENPVGKKAPPQHQPWQRLESTQPSHVQQHQQDQLLLVHLQVHR